MNIILDDGNLQQYKIWKSIIDFLDLFSSTGRKQRVLIVSSNNPSLSDSKLKAIFEYAWFKKFLRFTIFQQEFDHLSNKNKCLIQYYNPFRNITFKEKVSDKTKLFPNKLNNVYGYTAKLAVISNASLMGIFRDPFGNIIKIEANKFYLLSTTFELLNFSIRFVEVGINMSFFDGSRKVDEKLEKNEVNLYVKPESTISNNKYVLIDIENECDKIVAAVPTKSITKREFI